MADVFTPELTFGNYRSGIMTPTAPGAPYRTIQAGNVFADYALLMQFTTPQYWVAGTQQASLAAMSGYSFTRSGEQGEYNAASPSAVAYYAPNTPAINSNGYWPYGANANIMVNSQDFSAASWTKTETTLSQPFDTLSPDGSNYMQKLTVSANNAGHFTNENLTPLATGLHTYSVFVKAGTARYVQLLCDINGAFDSGVNFDLQTGTVTQQAAGWTGYIVNMGGGIYRLVGVVNAAAAAASSAYIVIINSGTAGRAGAFAGAGESLYIWQVQTIAGNFPDGGPIIRTAGAAASIGASALSNTISTLADATMLIWADVTIGSLTGGAQRFLRLDDAGANEIVLNLNAAGVLRAYTQSGAGLLVDDPGGASTVGTRLAFVLLRSGGTMRVGKVISGVLTWFAAASVQAWPANLTNVRIGHEGGTSQANGAVKGCFIKAMSATTDAAVLAAVAEVS